MHESNFSLSGAIRLRKLTRPRFSQILGRERLLAHLDGMDGQILWVCGPAGAGKTILVSDWLDSKKIHHLWYQIDASDMNLTRFARYLLAAVPNELVLPTRLDDLLEWRLFFEAWFTAVPANYVLVFDGYQAGAEDFFHEVFLQLLEVVPDDVRVLVLSRQTLPRVLIGLELQGRVQCLTGQALRFTLAESHALLNLHGEVSLPQVRRWHVLTDGWAMGLLLHTPRYADKQRSLFEYFAREVLDVAQPDTQHFLLRTCLLPEVTRSLGEALSGLAQVGGILRFLCEHHCFTSERGPGRYVYHPLFAEFLQIRAKNRFLPTDWQQLQRDTAMALAGVGAERQAAELLLSAADETGLAELLLHCPQADLPAPWGELCRAQQTADVDSLLKLWTQLQASQATAGLRLCWAALVSSYLAQRNYIALDRWIDWLTTLSACDSPLLERHVARLMVQALLYRRPQCLETGELASWLARANLAQEPTHAAYDLYRCWSGLALPLACEDAVLLAPHLFNSSEVYAEYWQAWHLSSQPQQAWPHAYSALRQAQRSGHILAIVACELLLKWLAHESEQSERSPHPLAQLCPPLQIWDGLLSLPEDTSALRQLAQTLKTRLTPQQWLPPTLLSQFCGAALLRNIETDWIKQLIMQQELLPTLPIAAWPYPICIKRSSKGVKIYHNEQLVTFKGRRPQKALDLLDILLQHHPKPATEALVEDTLWPQVEGDKAHASFKYTLFRLRQLLGNEHSILLRGGQLQINRQYCWVA